MSKPDPMSQDSNQTLELPGPEPSLDVVDEIGSESEGDIYEKITDMGDEVNNMITVAMSWAIPDTKYTKQVTRVGAGPGARGTYICKLYMLDKKLKCFHCLLNRFGQA